MINKFIKPIFYVLVAFLGLFSFSDNSMAVTPELLGTPVSSQVFCPQDAKKCPDGSYVSRKGPRCEFLSCPTPKPSSSVRPRIEDIKPKISPWRSEKKEKEVMTI